MRHSRFRRGLSGLFRILDGIRRVFGGLVVLAVLVLVVVALVPPRPPRLKPGSLLEIRPYGRLVDAYTEPVSYRGWPVGEPPAETLLDDLVRTIDYAADDDRIVAAWLDLDYFEGSGLANLAEMADALERFRSQGKVLLASADTYDSDRYYLASLADTVVVDRLGEVFPEGYGLYRAYLAEGMERLGAQTHLFRSGDSKSAGETFTRDAMSEQSRRDEERLLGDLWTSWLTRVAGSRDIDPTFLEDWIDGYAEAVISAENNAARAAREAGLVDLVDTGDVLQGRLDDLVEDDPARRVLDFDYLWAVDEAKLRGPAVAVVPVRGVMVYGEGRTGEAGSDDVISRIEAARDDPTVEALVVRIDSVGGDVRAAEAIRRVLEQTRHDWEIPVVSSLGNIAASGGYWIAVESDAIVTRPETITGSIGVYSLAITFEEALAKWLGVRIDGVGTTRWTGSAHPGRPLDEATASLYRSGVADVDALFRELVADRRGLTAEEVSNLSGGIPWSGTRAARSGLADSHGGLKEAIVVASQMADIDGERVLWFEETPTFREDLALRFLSGRANAIAPRRRGGSPR